MPEAVLNTIIIGCVSAVFAAMLGLIVKMRRQEINELKNSLQALEKSVNELRVTTAAISTQVSPLWARVQAQISEDLHHPAPQYREMDELLERLDNLTITPPGRDRLKILLIARSKDVDPEINQEQRDKAVFMVSVMDMVLAEKAIADAGDTAVSTIAKIEAKSSPDPPAHS
jgi:hypothetical protein